MTVNPLLAIGLALGAAIVVTLGGAWLARRRVRRRIAEAQRPPAPIEPPGLYLTPADVVRPQRQRFRVSPVVRYHARRPRGRNN
jgi:hypothetical protein